MAIAVVFQSTCDVCGHEGTETEGAETYEFPAQLGVPAFVVELCQMHAEAVRETHAGLAALGRAPGKPGQPTPGRSGPRPFAGSGPFTCPRCGEVRNTTGALRAHTQKEHGTSLAGVGFYPANEKCEYCGDPFPNKQGLRAHIRRTHPEAKQSA